MKSCKTCGNEKEEGYKRNSYCRKCTVERTRQWRLKHPGYSKKAWEISKRRKIRNEFCSICNLKKEEKWAHTSYCAKCASDKARKWEIANKDKVHASIEKRRQQKQSTTCLECSKIFFRKRGEKVCSLRCKLLNEKIVNQNGCWLSPRTSSRGYGQISFRGLRNGSAHRIAYSEFCDEIPRGMYVCHTCDTPSCYNPEHLFLGTPQENVQDGIKKGRIKHIGAKERNCKLTNLTNEQIHEMRKLHKEGFDYKRLARIFKCQKEWMSKIIRHKVRK